MSSLPSVDALSEGVRAGDRALLARAITLIESRRNDHRDRAQALLGRLLPFTGGAHRIGITGVPGVGKSTLIESFGSLLTGKGHRVAVLAIDPSSEVSRGSILGDKTRMGKLSVDPAAFVRPSPSRGTLGGVAAATRETMLVCEAAGYDVVLVETVGVGQSETVVAGMVDSLLLLVLAGAGDELQGIKRGILERVDLVAVNKADGDNHLRAQEARSQLEAALRYMRPPSVHWRPPVVTASGLEGGGLDDLWQRLCAHRETMTEHGELEARRRRQRRAWLWSLIDDELGRAFRAHPRVAGRLEALEQAVEEGSEAPRRAAVELLDLFRQPADGDAVR